MTVVLQIEPVWGTAPIVSSLYGVTRGKLLELGKAGLIRARKENPNSRSSRIVFCCSDVREWLEKEAPTPRAEAFEPRRGPGMPRTGDDNEWREVSHEQD